MAPTIGPRRLRLLRIDDDLNPGNSPTPQAAEQEAPTHLETVFVKDGDSILAGIGSWATAIQFWKEFNSIGQIDLIVSDVKFKDETSPLNALASQGERLPLPTGMSHFKAFAAIARAKGTTLGIGLHTKDATIWEEYSKSPDPSLRFMSLLAAHEIGELAAIIGEADGIPGAGVEACWSWLRQYTVDKPNFRQAIPTALSHYRRRIREMLMLPSDWRALVSWCGRMQAAANDPGAKADLFLTDESDPGFSLLRADGTKDTIFVRSLYADVPLGRQGFAFDLVPLPAECFALGEDENFSELDQKGNPKIGALVTVCGDLARAYEDCLKILESFPVPAQGELNCKLTDVKKRLRASNLAAAIAVILQDVRRESALFVQWQRFYSECEWDPEHDRFSGNDAIGKRAIKDWLRMISKKLAREGSVTDLEVVEWFRVAGVPEDPDQKQRPGAVRCLRLLQNMEVAKYLKGQNRYVSGRPFSDDDVPELPDTPPAGFFAHSELGKAFSLDGSQPNDPSRTLRILFGHDKVLESGQAPAADSVLERQLGQAFGLSNKAATKFLESFREGHSYPWLKALCRDYARDELGWTDTATWPKSLLDCR